MDGTNDQRFGKTSLAWQLALQGKTGLQTLPLPTRVVTDPKNPWNPFVQVDPSMGGVFFMNLKDHLNAIGGSEKGASNVNFTPRLLEGENPGHSSPSYVMAETPRLMLVTDAFGNQEALASFLDRPKQDLTSIRVVDKKTGKTVGQVGFSSAKENQYQRTIPLGDFTAKREGFATEAKFALMKLAFDREHVGEMKATIFLPNDASEKLHQKLGFEEGERNYEGGYVKYKISEKQFRTLERQVENAGGIEPFSQNRGKP